MPSAITTASSIYSTSLSSNHSKDNIRDRDQSSQHAIVKHAVLDGHLIHPSITSLATYPAIADIACGHGSWLQDVYQTYGPSAAQPSLLLVGFDIDPPTIGSHLTHDIQLVQHDCTLPFPLRFIGQFDLVNINNLACSLSKEDFQKLISHAITLLRPGGYLQWLEAEARLFRQYPTTPDFREALYTINSERQSRGLVTDTPHFMLQEFLKYSAEGAAHTTMSILDFKLRAGGACRDGTRRHEDSNKQFSNIVMSSIQRMLAASLERSLSGTETAYIHCLVNAVAKDAANENIVAGATLPYLLAQRNVQ
ncbi:hypothetical protein ACN47E_000717 [Coniothyrium glycines]